MFRDPQQSLLHISVCGLLVIVFFFAGAFLLTGSKPYEVVNKDLAGMIGIPSDTSRDTNRAVILITRAIDCAGAAEKVASTILISGIEPDQTETCIGRLKLLFQRLTETKSKKGDTREASQKQLSSMTRTAESEKKSDKKDHVLLKLSGIIALVPLLGFISRMLAMWWFEPWNVIGDPARRIVSDCAKQELLGGTGCPIANCALDKEDPTSSKSESKKCKVAYNNYRERLRSADPDWLYAFYYWPRVNEGLKNLIDNRNHFVYIYQNLIAATWLGLVLAMIFFISAVGSPSGCTAWFRIVIVSIVLLGMVFFGFRPYLCGSGHGKCASWPRISIKCVVILTFVVLTFLTLCTPASCLPAAVVAAVTVFWLCSLTAVEQRMHKSARLLDLAWIYSQVKTEPQPRVFDKRKLVGAEWKDENGKEETKRWEYI